MAKWQAEYGDHLSIVLAASGDSRVVAAETERLGEVAVGLDPDQAVAEAFKSDGTPTAVVIGPDGRLISDLARNKDEMDVMIELLMERARPSGRPERG